ncbi:MAG TPA: S1 RNA-binding domain-containing protein [Polyangiaceae bacterium]|nr:S1 RNA-binding domain-containing protein [Polyangiaceae bacterium]
MPQDSKGESFAALFEADAGKATPHRRSFNIGEELDVVVVQIGRDAVFVGLDGKQEGFIESKDLTSKEGNLTVKIGSRITARVAEIGGRLGAVRLAPVYVRPPVTEEPDAVPEAAVGGAAGLLAVGANVRGTVALVERYGVFLQITAGGPGKRGVRGLVPTAELGVPRGADLHKMFPLSTELEAKIIAIDDRNRIKLSVVALNADVERREYEAHRTQGQGKSETGSPKFGTLGDLFSQKKR